MYTDVVARTHSARHSILNQWDLIAAVDAGLAGSPARATDGVEMPADAAARSTLDAKLAGLGITTSMRVALLHVSAKNVFRRWPESSFAQVAAAIVCNGDDRAVVIFGGPSDREAAERITLAARALAGDAGARIVGGEGWTLSELRAAMDRAALFIGGDSGPLHIASTSEVPIVALYGPTLPSQWAPWRAESLPTRTIDAGPLPCRPCTQRVCEPGDFRCLTNLRIDHVQSAVEALLESPR
jgi:ADP-heptose:LPS heptosyltransferase